MMELDIVARDIETGTVTVVVELKLGLAQAWDQWQHQLARYMIASRCHHALLVTATEVGVFYDDFSSMSEDSIKLRNRFDLQRFFTRRDGAPPPPPRTEQELENLVLSWLTLLAGNWNRVLPNDPEIIEALVPEFVAVLAGSEVYATTTTTTTTTPA